MSEKALERKENDVLLKLKVRPNSENFEVVEANPWRNLLKVNVVSPAKKGKANRELLKNMKSILKKDIKIISGRKSRKKKVLVKNASVGEVKKKLGLDNLPSN